MRMTREAMVMARKKIRRSRRSITRATWWVERFSPSGFDENRDRDVLCAPASILTLFALAFHFLGFSPHFWAKAKEDKIEIMQKREDKL